MQPIVPIRADSHHSLIRESADPRHLRSGFKASALSLALTAAALPLPASVPHASAKALSKDALLDLDNTRYQAYFRWNMCTFKDLNGPTHSGRGSGKAPAAWWKPWPHA